MGLLSKLLSKVNDPLLGEWVSDPTDLQSIAEMGNIKMSFKKDGSLTYEIIEESKSQFIFMTYNINGNLLITNQPSHPQQEVTEFSFKDPNTLILKFGNLEARYIRVY